MSNKEQEIEQIAQNEVYPGRYFGRKFPGEWPSERHHAVCLAVARNTYEDREKELQQKTAETLNKRASKAK